MTLESVLKTNQTKQWW